MAQVTWRAEDELVERARRRARDLGQSLNQYVTNVLDAATNPSLAGDEAQQIRERLAAAGLLATVTSHKRRPTRAAVEAAGRRAARGRSVSDIVVADRGSED